MHIKADFVTAQALLTGPKPIAAMAVGTLCDLTNS